MFCPSTGGSLPGRRHGGDDGTGDDMAGTPEQGHGSIARIGEQARRFAESLSRIAAEPGEIIRGTDPDDVVTVGRDLAGETVELRLSGGWRERVDARTIGAAVRLAHHASGLEYLRRQLSASHGDVASVPIPRSTHDEPPTEVGAVPATYTATEMIEALAAQRAERPRLVAAHAERLAPQRITDTEGWIEATVVGGTIQSFDVDADRLRFAPDRGVEQAFLRLFHRAAALDAEHERTLERDFPATARLAAMSAAVRAANQ
jgi:hypothetical protein